MKTKVAIIGGGPGGAAAAMYLLKEGVTPVIIEKDTFPRYHIGESLIGGGGAQLRELGFAEKMKARNFPVKHGVKVIGAHPWFLPVMARDENWELQEDTTWQVRRDEFDKMLLEEAISRGAILVEGAAKLPIVDEAGVVRGVEVALKDGGSMTIESEVLLDCSGLSTFLASKGVTGPKYIGNYDKQIAIFSQIDNGIRDSGEERSEQPGNTLIFYKDKYHWSWWIPLDDKLTSVGVVVPAAYFREQEMSKEEFLAKELHEIHPNLTQRIPEVKLVEETRVIRNYSYQVKDFCGPGFICIGDAHRFLDPIFSFGVYLAMKEAEIAVPVVCKMLNGEFKDVENPFRDYQMYVEKGMDVLEDALDGFWEHPLAFAHLTYNRHFDQMVDIFAGRIYENQPSDVALSFRELLGRDRVYSYEDDYSVPIGSRFHPERAPIWVQDTSDLEKIS